ncbi:hypothetical protein G3I34_29685, partial [Streptomyces sp. SID8014]|nr:hypothetical protein [Streptomyces sp. SID8014]
MAERSARRRVPVPPSPTASRLVLALVCAVWTVILAVAGASVGLPGQQPAAGAAAAGFERALPAPPGVHTPPWVRVHAPTRERADGHTG